MSDLTREFVLQLPKTDLHVHLDGSLRYKTLFDLAKKQNLSLPAKTESELKKIISCVEPTKSLDDYLKRFEVILSVLQDEDSLYRVAFELVEDAATENIRYMEVRYSPILHTKKGLSLTQVSDAVLSGVKNAEKVFKIKTGVIICGLRNINPENSIKLVELSIAYKNKGVVGFDLAGVEYNHPAIKHKDAFDLAQQNNLNITIHAGEDSGSDGIHQAIHGCGANRIGHGIRLLEDVDLLNYVNDHRIPLEICVKSNYHTKAVPCLKKHPLMYYLNFGLRVTMNTDNRMISDTTMTDEFMLGINELGLTYIDIKNIIINGFKSAFIPFKEKKQLVNEVLKDMSALEDKCLQKNMTFDDKI